VIKMRRSLKSSFLVTRLSLTKVSSPLGRYYPLTDLYRCRKLAHMVSLLLADALGLHADMF